MWMHLTIGLLLLVAAIFLILLVLVQRGRGGGLAGALGGMGGQSAFGAKAGDTFTKITIWAATFWILLCMAAVVLLNPAPPDSDVEGEQITSTDTSTAEEDKPDTTSDDKPSSTTPATDGEATGDAGAGSTTSGGAATRPATTGADND